MARTGRSAGKRGAGDGSYRQRKDGRWELRMTLPGGKSKSYYGATREEVRSKHLTALRDLSEGRDLSLRNPTVAQFLDDWLAHCVKPNLAPKTHQGYLDITRLYLKPALGSTRLDKLTPMKVTKMTNDLMARGLSPRSAQHARAVLRSALGQALDWQLVSRNVAASARSPRQKTVPQRWLTLDEARKIIAVAESHRLAALYRIALSMGLRQGELLGLRWEDIDFDRQTLSVNQVQQRVGGRILFEAPKTAKSRRTLPMPTSVAHALRAHQERQAMERAAMGVRWCESGLVFVSTRGTPLDARNVLRIWHALRERAGATRCSFHASRHTAASLMIAEGIPMKTVQEMLGHSVMSTTADVYSHLFPEALVDASRAMDRALG